jgi:hypothetical protein
MPVSKIPFISESVEWVASKCFPTCSSFYLLFPGQQSACRFLLLYGDSFTVCAIDKDQVSALVLLYLSAAFDAVDHDIRLTVLDRRFGIKDSAMSCFRSYLGHRTQTFVYSGRQSV